MRICCSRSASRAAAGQVQAVQTAYLVTNADKVIPLNVESGAIGKTISLDPSVDPLSLAETPDASRIFVGGQDQAAGDTGEISVIDATTNEVVRTIDLPDPAYSLAVSPNGSLLFVVLGNRPEDSPVIIDVIDVSQGTVSRSVSFPGSFFPPKLYMSPDGSQLFAQNLTGGTTVIDTSTYAVRSTISFSGIGVAFAPDGKLAYEVDTGMVGVIDLTTDALTKKFPVDDGGPGLAITPNGQQLFIPSDAGGSVIVVNTSTDETIAKVTVSPGQANRGVAVAPDGSQALVGGMSSITFVDTTTDSIERVVPVSGGLVAIGVASPSSSSVVSAFYKDLLNRQSDSSENSFWVGSLQNGASRREVAYDIATSPEYFDDLVSDYYHSFLDRPPDQAGLEFWVSQLESGATDEQAVAGILGSPESYSDAGGSASAFVTKVYEALLMRSPSQSEIAYWSARMASGLTTEEFTYAVATSNAYYSDLVSSYYELLLGRSVDGSGLSYWLSAMSSRTTDESVLSSIAGSAEFFYDNVT